MLKRKYAFPSIPGERFYKKQVVSPNYAKNSRRLDKAMAKRIRGSRSKVARKSGRKSRYRKTRGKSMVVSPNHGVSYTRTNLVYRTNSAIVKKLTQPSVWNFSQPIGMTSLWNSQGVIVGNGSFTEVGAGSLTRILFNQAFSLYNGTTGSIAVPDISPNQTSYKFYIQSVKSSFILTNQAPTDVEIDIYDLVARTSSEYIRTPINAWNLGINQQDNSTATQSINAIGAQPYESKLFNLNYKVVRKATVNISPGRSHNHTFNLKVNRLVDTSYMENFAQVKGITSYTMFVGKGALGDSLNSSAIGIIGFTPLKVVLIQDRQIICRALNEHPRVYSNGTFLDLVEPANVFTQDEGSGQPQNIGPAFRATYA